jgi:hypothetical protein
MQAEEQCGKLSSVEKLNEARRSKGSLKQKKGWRMKLT